MAETIKSASVAAASSVVALSVYQKLVHDFEVVEAELAYAWQGSQVAMIALIVFWFGVFIGWVL